jgi:hypothetical protein
MADDAKKIPIGKGLADRGKQTIEAHAKYQRYAGDTQVEGNEPKKFEDWAKDQGYEIVEYDKRKP